MSGNEQTKIVIQERDRQLLRELASMRVIDREQAKCAAGFGSTTRTNHRLLALTRTGLLRRFFVGTSGGGKKALYALSEKGARLVAVPFRGPRRRLDEVLIADFFVTHQLAVNQLYCQLKCRSEASPAKLARWESFFEPVTTNIPLIPDAYFEAEYSSKVIAGFVEVDLGHESGRIWKEKVQKYLQYAISGDFQKRFNQPQFRVLIITNSERRLQSIRALVSEITEKIFWFASLNSINDDCFWSPIWLRPSGDQRQSLLMRLS